MDTATTAGRRPLRPRGGIEVRTDGLAIGVLSADGTALLRLDGQLDAASAPDLLQVGRSLAGAGSQHFVFDCAHLRFCDTAGLTAFTSIRRDPQVQTVALVRTPAPIAKLLALTGLDALLEISPA